MSSLLQNAGRKVFASTSQRTIRTLRTLAPLRPVVPVQSPVPRRTFAVSRTLHQSSPSSASATGAIAIKELSASEYDRAADEDMDMLHDSLEVLCEDYMTGAEVEYSSGVMTLITPRGTYVINKQPPNQQIWISSPLSGPARFGYSPDGVWVHHRRNGVTLGGVLDQELKEVSGETDWEGTGLK